MVCLDGVVNALAALFAGLLRPWEVSNWDDEEGVAGVGDTSKSVVPSGEGSQETKDTTSLDETGMSVLGVVEDEVADREEEEGHVEEEEEQEEGDGRAQGADQQDGGEDKPSGQEETDSVLKVSCLVCCSNLEATWSVDDGVREPETTVRGQSSSTKGVTDGHLPHTSEKLDQTTIAECDGNDDVWFGDTSSLEVDEGEDEGGQRESGETKRSWVGKLALSGWLVKTWLEFTTEGWEACRLASVGVCEWVPSIVIHLLAMLRSNTVAVAVGGRVTVGMAVGMSVGVSVGVAIGVSIGMAVGYTIGVAVSHASSMVMSLVVVGWRNGGGVCGHCKRLRLFISEEVMKLLLVL